MHESWLGSEDTGNKTGVVLNHTDERDEKRTRALKDLNEGGWRWWDKVTKESLSEEVTI